MHTCEDYNYKVAMKSELNDNNKKNMSPQEHPAHQQQAWTMTNNQTATICLQTPPRIIRPMRRLLPLEEEEEEVER